jgi:hypothetical protein
LNMTPSRPTRCCLYETGPRELNLIASTTSGSKGRLSSSQRIETSVEASLL